MTKSLSKYQPDIKRLTKANSIVIQDRVVYIVKKKESGKTVKLFVAYDYETKIKLAAHWDKETLIEFLNKQNFKEIE